MSIVSLDYAGIPMREQEFLVLKGRSFKVISRERRTIQYGKERREVWVITVEDVP